MDPDDDLGDDDGKDDHLGSMYHDSHGHMHSIPHGHHQMDQPIPGMPYNNIHAGHVAVIVHLLICHNCTM